MTIAARGGCARCDGVRLAAQVRNPIEMTEGVERRVISVNIAHVRTFAWRGRTVETGIFKEPVAGPVSVGRLGLAGDVQADPRVHGGPRKAVYVYPVEHYAFWQRDFPGRELPPGAFGENLTIAGLLEHEVREGDRLHIGTAAFEVTTPRLPCFKLALKFEEPGMIERFFAAGRSGFYLSVVQEGTIQAGTRIELSRGTPPGDSIADVFKAKAPG